MVGNKLSSTLIVNVQPVLVSTVSPASPHVTAGHTQTFIAAVTQAVNTAIAWSATGGVIDPVTGSWTAPTTPGTYTITATASAGNTTSTATTVTVIAMPSISTLMASPASINYGQSTSLTAVFTAPLGSQASLGTAGAGSYDVSASVITGAAVSKTALAATTTFTLTVTNAAGDLVTKTALVTVIQPFSPTGSMAFARTGQTTTQLADGSVLVAGGTAAPQKAEIYNTSTGTFALTATAT